ncbi:class I SAM-dependent methyltransferase [Dictyoglomus thermophilum]|uniref:L-glutaminyl-2-N-methyltransferase StsG n=1 Tax=Dictyoglomus thermophilum (strain ATCC 35947 / DSM 3960 / H-6-12) TaxID=309799 RepID=B5YE77_DICT6|nr:class I SAM-dependent methyltransferase [Dictyoglomus thermophilum]ACI19621.1 putative L-glutaminyl-2-N-methyltransferase StsG [Dictyoglomus thermophilum H-6-12]MCX7720983.1 methyltransferase domain-containing protein [Dictyoglomus thermophilum]
MEENRDWRDIYFSRDYYTYLAKHLTPERTRKEVDFIESILSIKRGHLILDLGCGFGRHTLELGKRGYRTIGIDRSEDLIEIAKEEAKKDRVFNVEFYVMEYKDIEKLGYKFDVVFSLYTSFGLSTYEEDKEAIEKVYNVLKKGGRFLIDIENRDALLRYFIPYSWDVFNDYILLTEHQFEPESGYYISNRIVFDLKNNTKKEFIRKIYLYTASEIARVLEEKGFRVERFIGDYDGKKFHVASRRLIVVGVKK